LSRVLEDRARKRLAAEIGTIRKPHENFLRIALAYPNRYYIGMSNVGFQAVYKSFDLRPRLREAASQSRAFGA
jgi:hypothetical protein